ncbi:MAG: response regulator [bacterium]
MITTTLDGERAERFRVLVADDDAVARTLLSSLVRAKGHSVTTAADGLDAWVAFETFNPHLVVADWTMPGMDGLELCSRIRQRVGDQCFVLLVTARDGQHDLQKALAAGADDYITKPTTADQFWARIIIAERRLWLARARRIAEAEASRMRWLAGIGQTVLTLQHEINNPLTALFGALEIIGESPNLSAEAQHNVSRALHQAERIADVVRQLSALEQPATVELIPGFPMLALVPRPDLSDEAEAAL